MVQHRITLVKVRPTSLGKAYIRKFVMGEVEAEMDQYKNPWLLYWCQWYDPWSMSDLYSQHLPVKEKKSGAYGEAYEVVDIEAARIYLKGRLRKKYQWQESLWFHRRLMESIVAYDGLCPAKILIHNQCTACSLGDSQLFG